MVSNPGGGNCGFPGKEMRKGWFLTGENLQEKIPGVWEGIKKGIWIIPAFPLCPFQGEHFGTTEATEAFFAMTRLFQSNDVRTGGFHLPAPGWACRSCQTRGFWGVGGKLCPGGALEAIPGLERNDRIMTRGSCVGWFGGRWVLSEFTTVKGG